MKVKRNTLLLFACLVWSAAGFNILRIGLVAGLLFDCNYGKAVLVAATVQNKIEHKGE